MLTTLLVVASLLTDPQQRAECEDVASCRQAALDAAAEKAFERFHDLAWRAVQKGRRNDPELMLLLARAQSLSGRPGDALVMLRRLADVGDARDAITHEDFDRVRALPGWAAVEAAILAGGEKRSAAAKTALPGSAPLKKPSPEKPAPARTDTPPPPPKPESTKMVEAPEPLTASKAVETLSTAEPPRRSAALVKSPGEEAIRLPSAAFEPIGLAYDNVSRRFVVGDRRSNKLIVADEVFKRINDLIGPGSGGFGTLMAVEIDRRRGDLWVTSSGLKGSASLHKLQLVSGRVLAKIDVPEEWEPAALNDISITDNGELLLVDGPGGRLLTLAPSAQDFARAVPLEVTAPVSIAVTGPVVYVAHADGLSTVDLKSGNTAAIRAAKGVVLTGLRRIRWYQDSLVGIQGDPDDRTARLVRIRVNQQRHFASRLDRLDDSLSDDGSVLTISGSTAYYVARTEAGPTIRRVSLR